MQTEINEQLTDIIADVNRIRKLVNDDELEPKISGDEVLTKLSEVSNSLDDIYNQIRGL